MQFLISSLLFHSMYTLISILLPSTKMCQSQWHGNHISLCRIFVVSRLCCHSVKFSIFCTIYEQTVFQAIEIQDAVKNSEEVFDRGPHQITDALTHLNTQSFVGTTINYDV